MKKILIGAALLAVSAPAFAAEWQKVTTDTEGVVVSIDTESLKQSGTGGTVWVKYDYASSPGGGYTLEKHRFDCANETYSITSVVKYSKSGRLLDTRSVDPILASVRPVVPETVGADLLRATCPA